ncbi:MAG: cupin domain-containing protein [Planctomycetaceae bacterium]|jgi:quercetin dioxygenase-like cupin family protein|nr:cupin domain-containing protein [Planctomycetaceae bacterium]
MKIFHCLPLLLFVCVCVVLFDGQNSGRLQPVTSAEPPRPAVKRGTAANKTVPSKEPEAASGNTVSNDTGSLPTVSPAKTIPQLFLTPEFIRLPSTEDGRNHTITLMGDPHKDALYVTRTVFPRGRKTPPHTHTDSRTVVVLQGTYYYGAGSEFNEEKMIALPPGSFFTEPAGEPHYTWAKDSEVMVQTTAVGPSGTQIIPEAVNDNSAQDKSAQGTSAKDVNSLQEK